MVPRPRFAVWSNTPANHPDIYRGPEVRKPSYLFAIESNQFSTAAYGQSSFLRSKSARRLNVVARAGPIPPVGENQATVQPLPKVKWLLRGSKNRFDRLIITW